jgi:uncharacterized protein YdeI (YjbR/CyaY-like superfamily)
MHLPRDLATVLRADPGALHYFESLPDVRQRLLVLGIEEAGDRVGRRRRIARALSPAGLRA